MQVKDIMTLQVEIVHPDTSLTEAAKKMSRLEIGPLPVCDGEKMVGMITDRDITVRATAKGSDTTRVPAHSPKSMPALRVSTTTGTNRSVATT